MNEEAKESNMVEALATFKKFEDFRPFTDAPVPQTAAAPSLNINAPVFILKKPDDALTLKLRDEV